MGILGLESAFYLSDRIFNVIDTKSDDVIDFEEYLDYLNRLMNGDEEQKLELQFRLIDQTYKG